MNNFTKLAIVLGIAGMLLMPALSYAQTTESAVTSTIGYFYSASGQMMDAEDNNGAMSSYLTRSMRYNGTDETFAVSNIKDITADLDSSGNVLNKYTYTAYGTQTSYPSTSNVQDQTLSINTNPFTYSDYYTDSESGNYYLNARYYDPVLGIFFTSDSYNLPNRYMYVNGNPVMATDPAGHWAIDNSCIHIGFFKHSDGTSHFHWGGGTWGESRANIFQKDNVKIRKQNELFRYDKSIDDPTTKFSIKNQLNNYTKLGQGEFGTVYKKNGTNLVYKIFNGHGMKFGTPTGVMTSGHRESFAQREARISNDLGYKDVCTVDGGLVLRSPFATTGEGMIKKIDYLNLAIDLDEKGFYVNDFRPDNVGYVNGILRLIDVGNAVHLNQPADILHLNGKQSFMQHQLLGNKRNMQDMVDEDFSNTTLDKYWQENP